MLGTKLETRLTSDGWSAPGDPIAVAPSKHPKLDHVSSSEEQPALELPALAPELWLTIARFMGSGTRSCSRLASTCLDLHHLLTPFLMTEVTVNESLKSLWDALPALSGKTMGSKSRKIGKSSRLLLWEEKILYVRVLRLEAGVGPWLSRIVNVEHLEMTLRNVQDARDFGCSGDWPLSKLTHLTLTCESFDLDVPGTQGDNHDPYVPFDFELNFPHLKTLTLKEYYLERIGTALENGCPELEKCDMLLGENCIGFSEDVPNMPASLAAKIGRWQDISSVWWTVDMLESFPEEFKPSEIVVGGLLELSQLKLHVLPKLTEKTTLIVEHFNVDETTVDMFHEFVAQIGQDEVGPPVQVLMRAYEVEGQCQDKDSRFAAAELVLAWLNAMEDPTRSPRLELLFEDSVPGSARRVAECFVADQFQGVPVERTEDERDILTRAGWALSRWLKKQREKSG